MDVLLHRLSVCEYKISKNKKYICRYWDSNQCSLFPTVLLSR